MIEIENLRNLNTPEHLAITNHARQRLIERGIMISDIINCIATGEIIKQYEDDTPLPSCLILGVTESMIPIHIVVSHDNEWIYLITSYYPDKDKWEADFKTRKKGL